MTGRKIPLGGAFKMRLLGSCSIVGLQVTTLNRDDAVSLAIDSILRDGCSDITSESLELNLIRKFRRTLNQTLKKRSSIAETSPKWSFARCGIS